MYCVLTIARYPRWLGIAGFFSMAFFRIPLWLNKKISFWKLLGCGKNGSFNIKPDWRQWGILTVCNEQWAGEENAFSVTKQLSPFIAKYLKFFRCEIFTIILQPIEGHGEWDGKKPFGELPKQTNYDGVVCVLTRATIRLNRLRNFWKHTSAVAAQMANAPGFMASVGIGEIPFLKQATFSIWQSKELMKQFAYGMLQHTEVIRKTRNEKWYSEDMFVRFKPIAWFGKLNGINPFERKL